MENALIIAANRRSAWDGLSIYNNNIYGKFFIIGDQDIKGIVQQILKGVNTKLK